MNIVKKISDLLRWIIRLIPYINKKKRVKIEIEIDGEWIDITNDVVSFEIDSPFKHN